MEKDKSALHSLPPPALPASPGELHHKPLALRRAPPLCDARLRVSLPPRAPPLHHAVTIHLTKSNFLIWRAQLLPYLRSTKLMGYLDGSIIALAKYVAASTVAGAQQVPNPAYTTWYDQDQQVLSGLVSSISEQILVDVVSATTSKEAWDILQGMYSSATCARLVQIHIELDTTKKRDLLLATEIKGLATEMSAAGFPLRDNEVITYLLAGFGPDYDSSVTSMTTKTEPLTLDDVYAQLMAYESRQQ
ncbi:hypothetical protein PR202_ga11983 [Eleusine coracana subsp. coracana]|uniref:Retrotransposon Copia-like N-terminal domain-containing protein n=1 Tax=Eleusine coracana subsp. coracana TaxID=191504 RepID=A0AAV5CB21_ELECO|nr:hypothetical protein PR202_ga11983 [Eleusine coracana subsp. coracana]